MKPWKARWFVLDKTKHQVSDECRGQGKPMEGGPALTLPLTPHPSCVIMTTEWTQTARVSLTWQRWKPWHLAHPP